MNKRLFIGAFIVIIGTIIASFFLFPKKENKAAQTDYDVFEAKVSEIISEREIIREDGSTATQQDLRLTGLTGLWQGKEIMYKGISATDIIAGGIYKKGDRVVINYTKNINGDDEFYVVDYVRRPYIYLLALVFALVVVLIGKWKGIKALIGLFLTFIVIMQFIIPQISVGRNPLLVSLIGSLVILTALIYFTEGLNKKSHVAILSIFFALSITLILSVLFSNLTRLTGLAQEEAAFLLGLTKGVIDFRGLLLAGILLGTVGVLDDGVVSQIEAVAQIKQANPRLSKWQAFRAGFAIGNTHLGAIINTLFLTYAGASLPVLLLFRANQDVPMLYSQVINSEIMATEIVRALVGSIGVALSLPIAAFLAAYWYNPRRQSPQF